jgi:hypothetical protein
LAFLFQPYRVPALSPLNAADIDRPFLSPNFGTRLTDRYFSTRADTPLANLAAGNSFGAAQSARMILEMRCPAK